ncbi:RUN domain-containing protein 1 [Episyrphus balteatus]|uniref:RUN domain-containing protein 1 n=1 Tax=Episyrphus balteatus TaxID=286459 RepID=UPI0024861A05|nr:RUN domain-containing protein 1 [Episyrphus balteatus]
MSLTHREVNYENPLKDCDKFIATAADDDNVENDDDNVVEDEKISISDHGNSMQQKQQQAIIVDLDFSSQGHSTKTPTSSCEEDNLDFDEPPHPLSERWSPLGANYDDTIGLGGDLLGREIDLKQLEVQHMSNGEESRPDSSLVVDVHRLKSMEEEQEVLTSSLMALTSHFAHVQLRVRQIVEAPSDKRDGLLKDLEEFAFRGIPEPMAANQVPNSSNGDNPDSNMETIRKRQCELIDHLKSQLSELEKFAYESGAPVLPQHILLEKQKIIIDELKQKLNLNVCENDLPQLSSEDLKNQVENAIGEFVGPLKMKEQLVAQLKTQITDLERFIAFLQGDAEDPKNSKTVLNEAYNSYAAKKKVSNRQKASSSKEGNTNHSNEITPTPDHLDDKNPVPVNNTSVNNAHTKSTESLNSKAHGLMDKASLLMQMFATTHFGLKPDRFQKNTLKKTSKGNHWGDLRAQLEVDIQEVASLAATLSFDREKLVNMRKTIKKRKLAALNRANGIVSTTAPTGRSRACKDIDFYDRLSSSDSDEDDEFYDWEKYRKRIAHCNKNSSDSINLINKELTTAVRKNFAITLQRLIQHGLRAQPETTSSLIVPFMRCLNPSAIHESSAEHRAARASSSFLARSNVFPPESSQCDNMDSETNNGFFGGPSGRQMHAWELILEYYYLKNGDEYNNTPARKLSQSFNLEIVGAQAVSSKQSLLSVIGMIIALHSPYKRSYNSHFKAFVCAGLNSSQLVEWLNLLFGCSELVDTYYTENSYVVRTGFRDSLRSIDVLSKYDFDLPVDLAVRHFRNL